MLFALAQGAGRQDRRTRSGGGRFTSRGFLLAAMRDFAGRGCF